MATLPGLALVATSLMVLARGGEPPRVDHRDREVLEAALKDILDPMNPLYADGQHDLMPPPRALTIGLHRLAGGDDDADIFQRDRMFSQELVTSWRGRNAGEPIPLKTLGLRCKEFRVVDVDELDRQAQKSHKSFWDLFWERYPDAVGCADISLPGYSRGGTAAVVKIVIARAEYHPMIYLVRLAQVEGRCNVAWRHLEIW
jgi:hypothetical protein